MKIPLSVLIVDDEPSFATVLAMDLQASERFTVVVAHSGDEGMQRLRESPFDLILLDYFLGPMTGVQFLQWMNDAAIDTPVIMLTAAGTEEVAVKAMKYGAYDYARKERLELHHLPILLEGVHERYLFRKEAKEREQAKVEEEKQRIAIQMFQTTVRTIAHHVNNSLAIIMLRSSITERHITKTLDPASAEPILQLVSDLRKQSSVIEAVVRSLVELSDVVYTKYAGDQAIIDIHTQVEKKLHQMQARPRRN